MAFYRKLSSFFQNYLLTDNFLIRSQLSYTLPMRTDLILFHLRLHFSLVFLVMSNQIVCCHTIKLYIWFVFVFIIFFCFAFISAFMHLLELCVCSELIAIVIAFGVSVSVCVFFWLFVLIAFRKTFLVHSNTEHSTHTHYTYMGKNFLPQQKCAKDEQEQLKQLKQQ